MTDRDVNGRTAEMRLLVCGGRDFDNRSGLFRLLDGIASRNNVKAIIQGDAPGADSIAKQWAVLNNVHLDSYPADWSIGPSAGPIRNRRMLEQGRPTHCLAMPGGRGTANMVSQAKAAGVKMWIF